MVNPAQRDAFDADVIVVGAEPIGLVTACALRHHGVNVRLLEERTDAKPNSRANNVWARPQELLHGIGVRDALAERSHVIRKQTVFLNGKPLDQVPLDEVASPFAKVLYSGQDVIETTLSEQLEARGGVVERGRKVTTVDQDADGVTVTVAASSKENGKEGDGAEKRLRCRYLVGADGTAGTVRKSLGLDFETVKLPGRVNRQIDARLRWQRSTNADQLWFFVYHHGFAGVLPVWEGYHRMFFLEDDSGVPDRNPTLEELQAHAREITGDATLTFSDPIWLSHSRFQHAVSPHYAKGRVFLVGDAGHFTLPIGGQGMNAGMHDAVGLAWRLAMTLANRAGPAVLASFDGERQGAHAELDANQAKGFDRLEYRGRLGDAALDIAGAVIPNLGSRLFGSDDLQQLSVAYPKSELSEEHFGVLQKLKRGVPRAGDRAPDAALIDRDGRTVHLFPLIYNEGAASWTWTLLAFDGREAEAIPALRAALADASAWSFVRSRLIVSAPSAMQDEAAAEDSLSDLDAVAHAAYGLDGTPALVLIRPDGHIALRAPSDRADRLKSYCERVFAPPPTALAA